MASSCGCPSSPIRSSAAASTPVAGLHGHPLGQLAEKVRYGFFGKIDVAVVEIAAIREDGLLVPSSSWVTTRPGLDMADA